MNYDFDNGFRVRTITTSSGWPTDFIHINDLAVPPPNPLAPTTVTNFTATPSTLTAAGGQVTLSANVANATSCTFTSNKPGVTGLLTGVACPNGTVTDHISLPPNIAKRAATYSFTLSITGSKKLSANTTAVVAAGSISGSYNFNNPQGMIMDGAQIWVASHASLTEINAADGSLVRTVSDASCKFVDPYNMALIGNHLWVVNSNNDSLTEVNVTTGKCMLNLDGEAFGFPSPCAIASDGTHLWITNLGGTVTEIDPRKGKMIRILSGSSYDFRYPMGIAYDSSGHLWVTNTEGYSVTEFNASDGSLVRILSNGSYGFNWPKPITYNSGHMWIGNTDHQSTVEINASSGSLVRIITGYQYGFGEATAFAFDGTNLWLDESANRITVFNASTGVFVNLLTSIPVNGLSFFSSSGIVYDGSHIWVSEPLGNSVAELNRGNGAVIRTVS